MPALISKIEATHEKERSKRQEQIDSNHVRLKNERRNRVSLNKSQRSSQSDSGSLDDLFEL